MKKRTYRVIQNAQGEWHWNLTAANGVNIIRCSGETYKNRKDCWEMMVDDQRGESFFRIIEVNKEGEETVMLDMSAAPTVPIRVTQTEQLIQEKMAELREIKDTFSREKMWQIINYLKSIQTVLRAFLVNNKAEAIKAASKNK